MTSVLITGANRGLGLEFARQYLAKGWRIFAACREPAAAKELQALAAQSDGKLTVHALEVTDDQAIAALAGDLAKQPIDVLINNAGVNRAEANELGLGNAQAWLDVFAANVVAPVHVATAFLPHVAKGDRRVIATISSRLGSIAENQGGSYAYRASKAAVNAAMRSLSQDARAKGTTVVVLHPGWVRTDMGGAAAPLTPSESITQLVALIDRIGPRDNGSFLNFDGKPIPW